MSKTTPPNTENEPTKKRRLFQKKRAGVTLTKEEIAEIKQKRKQLRADLKKEGVTSKKDFEVTASSLGYYFDKQKRGALLTWFLSGRVLPVLLAATLSGVLILYAFSRATQIHGFFTVNLSNDLFNEGFSLKERFADEYGTSMLNLGDVGTQYLTNTTIHRLPEGLEKEEVAHQESGYFAYSFYLTNKGSEAASLEYSLRFTNASQALDGALWCMFFVSDVDSEGNLSDTKMTFYAKASAEGEQETVPGANTVLPKGDSFISYYLPLLAEEEQFVPSTGASGTEGYRFAAKPFLSDETICSGRKDDLPAGASQKYTLVLWLEGEDPDCTDERIGGSAGLELNFSLVE